MLSGFYKVNVCSSQYAHEYFLPDLKNVICDSSHTTLPSYFSTNLPYTFNLTLTSVIKCYLALWGEEVGMNVYSLRKALLFDKQILCVCFATIPQIKSLSTQILKRKNWTYNKIFYKYLLRLENNDCAD